MPDPTPTDLTLMLGEQVDTQRAQFLINLALALAADIITPLPASAHGIILTAVVRAYVNPTGVTAETIGPTSYSRPAGGIFFTKAEERALGRSAGRGGAYTIDPTPLDAGDLIGVGPLFGDALDWT